MIVLFGCIVGIFIIIELMLYYEDYINREIARLGMGVDKNIEGEGVVDLEKREITDDSE